jgi:hypothetical protein
MLQKISSPEGSHVPCTKKTMGRARFAGGRKEKADPRLQKDNTPLLAGAVDDDLSHVRVQNGTTAVWFPQPFTHGRLFLGSCEVLVVRGSGATASLSLDVPIKTLTVLRGVVCAAI